MLKVINKEFIFNDPIPTPECHASTVIRLPEGGFLAAWFAGSKEGKSDVAIWVSRREEDRWSRPRPVTHSMGIPHWNPVLFQMDESRVRLFYKLGHTIADWKTMAMDTTDGGKSWSDPAELVAGDTSGGRGPVKNKAIRLSNGRILAPASVERGPWRAFIDVSDDGWTWSRREVAVVQPEAEKVSMIQPALWEWPKGHVHALMRTNQGCIYRSDSEDYGESWSAAYPTEMPNNNSGIDCVMTEDGRLVLVCNPVSSDWGSRSPLSVFLSRDNGVTFQKQLDLETREGEFSYPAIVAQGRRLHVTYTWMRKKIVFCEME